MAIIKREDGWEYMDDVKFSARMSETSGCLCNACHNSGRVIKITYPDAKGLSTRYREMWLCESCYEKLMTALEAAKWDE